MPKTGFDGSGHHVGVFVRLRRQELKLSQKMLADKMGASQELISRYETGTSPIRADDIPDLAEILEVPTDYFFKPHGSDLSVPTKRGEALLGYFYQLDFSMQSIAMRIVQSLVEEAQARKDAEPKDKWWEEEDDAD